MMVADSEDELASPGFKRPRQIDDDQTSVQIVFKLLSRNSKKKLEELIHQWAEWHAQECSLSEGSDEDLESGEETYFPALNVSADNSCTVSVYMDNQLKKKQRTDDPQFNKTIVPLYDLKFEFTLMSGDEPANKESVLDFLNASRCFNCDAYDHSLKECSKPFNKEVVNNARKLHQLKSKRPSGLRVLTRYYQNTPGGKFDGLKPGCLDPETRKLLAIGEFDPPPWLNRMREIGYPPGYIDLEDNDHPSGIIIYANGDTKEENEDCVNTISTKPKTKTGIDFPGINAPIPVNADQTRWAPPNFKSTGFISYNKENYPGLNFRGHSHNTQDYRHSMSDYSRNCENYAPGFLLLSNYANSYLERINQHNPHYSSYEYQKSWSTFHG